MAATPFRHISFDDHEPVTKEKLDQLQSNIQWIVDNTPVALSVDAAGNAGISSMIIVAGRATIPITNGRAATRVYFDGAFDASATPIVTTGVISDNYKQLWVGVSGIGDIIAPDPRGFDIGVLTKEPSSKAPNVTVHWIAMGKRSPDYDRF